jgi:hypothetical protein
MKDELILRPFNRFDRSGGELNSTSATAAGSRHRNSGDGTAAGSRQRNDGGRRGGGWKAGGVRRSRRAGRRRWWLLWAVCAAERIDEVQKS